MLADELAGTFPGCGDAPLARALLACSRSGEPVPTSASPGKRTDRWAK